MHLKNLVTALLATTVSFIDELVTDRRPVQLLTADGLFISVSHENL